MTRASFFLISAFTLVLIQLLTRQTFQAPTESPNLSQLANENSPSSLDRKCLMCKFSVSLINHALRTKRGSAEVDKIANNFCATAHLETPWVCSSVSKLFNNEIVKVLSYGFLTPNQVCGYLTNNTCGEYHNPLDDWEIHLDVSSALNKTQLLEERRRIEEELKLQAPQEPYKVLHISDTHVDLNYNVGSPAVCEEPYCCQESSTPKNGSAQVSAGYWGTYSVCDIPVRTFESALKAINSTITVSLGKIDYIIWTGDIQPHDVWKQNKKSANRVFDTVFEKIFEYLPNVKILPTLGNHEMVPVDSFSPSNMLSIAKDDSPVWLYKKLNSFWSHWLPQDTKATITKDGFYSTSIRKDLKVISLNTNFCHAVNFWLYINSTDPGDQLQWLVHELQISELLHQKVHIIGHIPPGADDCFRVWSRNYNKILRRFQDTVTGQFFGHTHNNQFEIFYNLDEQQLLPSQEKSGLSWFARRRKRQEQAAPKPISVGWIGPSITTFVNLNPSFRVYNIDPSQGYVPVDFETFFMNLTRANIHGTMDPVWESAGFFSKRFGVDDIKPQTMHELIVDVAAKLNGNNHAKKPNLNSVHSSSDNQEQQSDAEINVEEDKLFQLYRLFNSFSDKFDGSVYDSIPASDKAKFLCKYFTGQSHDMRVCKQFIHNV